MSQNLPKNKPPQSARNKMMDLLARRDHSEKELRKKLKDRDFTSEQIDIAIQYGKDHGWLPNDELENKKLSQKMADFLHKKNKGILYINHHLREKGLPQITEIDEIELEKAQSLLKNKNSKRQLVTREEKTKHRAKMIRFLSSRGFTNEIIRKALK